MVDFIQDTGAVLGTPLVNLWNNFIVALPGLIAAILILVLGYLIGSLIGHLVKKLLLRTKIVQTTVNKIGLTQEVGTWDIEGFLGLITKWSIFVLFITPAAEVVSFNVLASFFAKVAWWIPNLIIAIIIVLAGYVLAEYLSKKIKETRQKKQSLLADSVKVITMVFIAIIALKQIGVRVSLAENSFLIILAGVMVAFAIAFGLGYKDEAKWMIRELRKRI